MEKTVCVTGRGALSVKPDRIRLTVTLASLHPEYATAIALCGEKTDALRAALAAAGFGTDALKTTDFSVHPEEEGHRDKDGNYTQRFAGYRCRHTARLLFAADNHLLGLALGAIAAAGGEPEFDIAYTVSDPEAAKTALLEKAVADAKGKALVLARAAGVVLGELVRIDYAFSGGGDIARPLEGVRFFKNAAPAAVTMAVDMDPENIDLSDTVTVVWRI